MRNNILQDELQTMAGHIAKTNFNLFTAQLAGGKHIKKTLTS